MRTSCFLLAAVSLCLTQCESPDKLDETLASAGQPPPSPFAADTDPGGLPALNTRDGPVVIRDPSGQVRVTGQVKGGRMNGVWVFSDSKGEKLAEVSYRGDLRHGPVVLRYVTADGPAAGKMRMKGSYDSSTLDGKVHNFWPDGRDKFVRDFDKGTIVAVSGTRQDGEAMKDGEAMNLAILESREEDTLLLQLENFVQLHIRQSGASRSSEAPPPAAPQ